MQTNYRTFANQTQLLHIGVKRLYKRIKALAKAHGIESITKLEEIAGISPRTICKWGEIMPSADKLLRVARALNVSVDDLLSVAEPDKTA